MEDEKINAFKLIINDYRGMVVNRNFENENYRATRRYNFKMELFEILAQTWNIIFHIVLNIITPMRNLSISFGLR